MAWLPPPAAVFKTRFPEFTALADVYLDLIIAEAAGAVPDTWKDADRSVGVLFLTAHKLASAGADGSGPGGSGVAVTGAIKSEKVGDVSYEYAGMDTSAKGPFSAYGSTNYGKEFAAIARRYASFVLVA